MKKNNFQFQVRFLRKTVNEVNALLENTSDKNKNKSQSLFLHKSQSQGALSTQNLIVPKPKRQSLPSKVHPPNNNTIVSTAKLKLKSSEVLHKEKRRHSQNDAQSLSSSEAHKAHFKALVSKFDQGPYQEKARKASLPVTLHGRHRSNLCQRQ